MPPLRWHILHIRPLIGAWCGRSFKPSPDSKRILHLAMIPEESIYDLSLGLKNLSKVKLLYNYCCHPGIILWVTVTTWFVQYVSFCKRSHAITTVQYLWRSIPKAYSRQPQPGPGSARHRLLCTVGGNHE